jgi:hypothetical protein
MPRLDPCSMSLNRSMAVSRATIDGLHKGTGDGLDQREYRDYKDGLDQRDDLEQRS